MMHRFLLLLLLFSISCTRSRSPEPEFRLHLFQEPQQFDPAQYRSSTAAYFYLSIMRGLYRYHDRDGIVPEGGSCNWSTPALLECQLSEAHRWSNGERVRSDEYVAAFKHLIDPATGAPRASLIFSVKNALEIFHSKEKLDKLGIEKIDDFKFRIHFKEPDPYFLIKLSSTALFPRRALNPVSIEQYKNFVGTGPYAIDTWKNGQWVHLKPNPHYSLGHSGRPPVKFYFIENEMTALRLYEQGQLDFLRRLPTNLIEKYSNREDFMQIPMARFDYVGFGEQLQKNPPLRKALALALNYEEFKKMLSALGRPGCPSLPSDWLDRQSCIDTDESKAREIIENLKLTDKEFVFGFSQLGGEDIQKQAEWLENQWRSKLNIKIRLQPMEQTTYLNQLSTSPPDIFRKGVGLDLPICLSALETFGPNSTQNYSHYTNPKYDEILKNLRQETDPRTRKSLCRQGVDLLIQDHWIIPLGEIHFILLAKKSFTGWTINSMNQLDLSQLHSSNDRAN